MTAATTRTDSSCVTRIDHLRKKWKGSAIIVTHPSCVKWIKILAGKTQSGAMVWDQRCDGIEETQPKLVQLIGQIEDKRQAEKRSESYAPGPLNFSFVAACGSGKIVRFVGSDNRRSEACFEAPRKGLPRWQVRRVLRPWMEFRSYSVFSKRTNKSYPLLF